MIDKFLSFFQKVTEVDGNGNVLQHQNYKIEAPIEHKQLFFKHPIARNVIKQSIVSKRDFIKFINEYATPSSKIFYNESAIKAIFNYAMANEADYGDSYCEMPLEYTRDFTELKKHIDVDLLQKQFIRILKRIEPYITAFDDKDVDDMDIIEIAEHLQATKNINSIQRNTSQAFILDTEVKAGNSSMTIPRYITVEIPVYKNELELTAKFKIEIFLQSGEGGFIATMSCYKLEQSIEETVRELTRQVQEGCQGIASFMV